VRLLPQGYSGSLVVVVAVAVTVVMIVITFSSVVSIVIDFPVSVPVGVAVAMSPVAFAIMPAARALFVMRGIPGGALVGRPHVVTDDPAIVISLWRPKSRNPDKRGFRRGWRYLNADRRRCNPNVDRDLRPGRRREHCCNKPETHILFQHISFPFGTTPNLESIRNMIRRHTNLAVNRNSENALEEHHRHAIGGKSTTLIAGAARAYCGSPVPTGADLLLQHIRQAVQV
jgi:hypothetical protein